MYSGYVNVDTVCLPAVGGLNGEYIGLVALVTLELFGALLASSPSGVTTFACLCNSCEIARGAVTGGGIT